MVSKKTILGTGACALVFVSITCGAATTAQAQVNEIIVSAQKRDESLKDVPLSVAAIGEIELNARGIKSFIDYATSVPGLNVPTYFGPTGLRSNRELGMRGISSTTGGAVVGFYIDETPMPVQDPRLFDVNRVEVLRGPQGTLYGAGTAAGNIKIVTNQPDPDEFSGSAEGTVSITEEGGVNYGIDGLINVPIISEILALRVVGHYSDDHGFVDSIVESGAGQPAARIANSSTFVNEDVNDTESYGFRAALGFYPSSNISITPSVTYQKTDVGGPPFHNPIGVGDLHIVREIAEEKSDEFLLANLIGEVDFGPVTFVSSTSYYDQEFHGVQDTSPLGRAILGGLFGVVAGGATPAFETVEREIFTQELRLQSNNWERVNWLIGFYYQEDKRDDHELVRSLGINEQLKVDLMLPSFVNILLGDTILDTFGETDVKELAFFGEVTFQATDRLVLTAGLRYFDFEVRDAQLGAGPADGPPFEGEASEDGFVPKFNAKYDVSENTIVFANAAKGFRRGGPIPSLSETFGCLDELEMRFGSPEQPNSFESDDLWTYEIGTKSTFAGGKASVNANVYLIKWKNVQQFVRLDCQFGLVLNAGRARSRGFELETAFAPIEGLDIGVNVGYSDAEFTEGAGLGGGLIAFMEGDALNFAPEWIVNANAQYTFPLFGEFEGFIRGDYNYYGASNSDLANPELRKLPDWYLANLRAGISSGMYRLEFFVTNITDQRPVLGRFNQGPDFVAGDPVLAITTRQPRTFGLKVLGRF